MADNKFDLGDYVEVKDRIARLYEYFPKARIETTYELTREPDDQPKVIARAWVFRTPEDTTASGSGTSWMYLPGKTSYTKGSEVENAETSAVGRAIGMLGILIEGSVATGNEIRAKAGEERSERNPRVGAADHEPPPEQTTNGGLIGIAEKTDKRTGDYAMRQSPDGPFLGFRLKDGRKGFLVEAWGPLAEALAVIEPMVIGQRVQAWGEFTKRSLSNGGSYEAFVLERIKGPEFTLPGEPEPDTIPLFDEGTEAELDAAATAA